MMSIIIYGCTVNVFLWNWACFHWAKRERARASSRWTIPIEASLARDPNPPISGLKAGDPPDWERKIVYERYNTVTKDTEYEVLITWSHWHYSNLSTWSNISLIWLCLLWCQSPDPGVDPIHEPTPARSSRVRWMKFWYGFLVINYERSVWRRIIPSPITSENRVSITPWVWWSSEDCWVPSRAPQRFDYYP